MTSLPLLDGARRLRPADLPGAACEGLYVHIPFCFHKCHYCDFYSITRQDPQRMDRFVDLVLREAEFWSTGAPTLRPRTVFFGGGTPSLLPAASMRRLMTGLRERVDLSSVDEWTVECNPATVDTAYCGILREGGATRLSIGAQSFIAEELRALERHHDPQDVPRSVADARAAGFARLNADLIFAIPGQTMATWRRSLDAAAALDLPHLSCYALTYEPNTPLAVRRRLGQVAPAEEAIELAMLRETRSILSERGYEAYEISNFARPGEACRHNLVYWTGGNYVGLGPSAASHVEGWRFRNRRHLGEWESAVGAGELPTEEAEVLSPAQRAGELIMLRLRLRRGVDFADLRARTGLDARGAHAATIARLSGAGLLDLDERTMRLSDAGIAVADAVAAEFLAPGP